MAMMSSLIPFAALNTGGNLRAAVMPGGWPLASAGGTGSAGGDARAAVMPSDVVSIGTPRTQWQPGMPLPPGQIFSGLLGGGLLGGGQGMGMMDLLRDRLFNPQFGGFGAEFNPVEFTRAWQAMNRPTSLMDIARGLLGGPMGFTGRPWGFMGPMFGAFGVPERSFGPGQGMGVMPLPAPGNQVTPPAPVPTPRRVRSPDWESPRMRELLG